MDDDFLFRTFETSHNPPHGCWGGVPDSEPGIQVQFHPMLGSGATVVGALPPCHVEGEIQRSRLGQALQAPADKDRCASNPSRSRVTVASAAARLPSVPVTGAEEVPTTCPNTSGHSQHIPDTGYRITIEVFLCEVSRGSRFRQAVPGQQVVTVRGSVTVRTWARPRVGFHADREYHVNKLEHRAP